MSSTLPSTKALLAEACKVLAEHEAKVAYHTAEAAKLRRVVAALDGARVDGRCGPRSPRGPHYGQKRIKCHPRARLHHRVGDAPVLSRFMDKRLDPCQSRGTPPHGAAIIT